MYFYQKIVAVIMRMILAGTSPFIINSICKICAEFYPTNSQLFVVGEIYENTVLCIIGKPVDVSYSRVFRQGVESPVAAFERILRAVIDYIYLDVEDLDAEDLWQTDDIPAPNDFSLIQKEIEKCLQDALVNASKDDSVSSTLRISILDLLAKNFETTVDDRELAISIKVGGLLKKFWDMDVCELNLTFRSIRLN
jgi:hypothetical protein